MTRLVLIALAMFATSTLAADPTSARVAQKIAPKVEARPNRYLQAAAEAERRDRRQMADFRDVVELLASPQPKLALFVDRQIKHRARDERQTGVRDDDVIVVVRRLVGARKEPLHEKAIKILLCPATPLLELIEENRSRRHRIWMSNQPSVLTYERLNGAIGP